MQYELYISCMEDSFSFHSGHLWCIPFLPDYCWWLDGSSIWLRHDLILQLWTWCVHGTCKYVTPGQISLPVPGPQDAPHVPHQSFSFFLFFELVDKVNYLLFRSILDSRFLMCFRRADPHCKSIVTGAYGFSISVLSDSWCIYFHLVA